MCDEGEAPAGGLAGATGAVGAFGELGAGCDGGGIGLGSGCCARSSVAISRLKANAQYVIVFFTGIAQMFLAMVCSPDLLLTDY
jgi:hypothetical protein